jgi:hypothetical protein
LESVLVATLREFESRVLRLSSNRQDSVPHVQCGRPGLDDG